MSLLSGGWAADANERDDAMATEKELAERETASRAESIARGLANSPGFVLRLRAQYLDAVRAHDVAGTTESFLAMCAAGALLTSDERDAAHSVWL